MLVSSLQEHGAVRLLKLIPFVGPATSTFYPQIVNRLETSVLDPHFFADPDPGKNLHADPDPVPDPDPGGIRGRGLGVKGKNDFFLSFFHVSDDS